MSGAISVTFVMIPSLSETIGIRLRPYADDVLQDIPGRDPNDPCPWNTIPTRPMIPRTRMSYRREKMRGGFTPPLSPPAVFRSAEPPAHQARSGPRKARFPRRVGDSSLELHDLP